MYLHKRNDPRFERARVQANLAKAGKNKSSQPTTFAFSTTPPICSCGEAAWKDDFGYCERCGKQLPGAAA